MSAILRPLPAECRYKRQTEAEDEQGFLPTSGCKFAFGFRRFTS